MPWGTSFLLIFFIDPVMLELRLAVAEIRSCHALSSGFLSLIRNDYVPQWKMATKTLNDTFLDPQQTRSTPNFSIFGQSVSCQRNRTWTQKMFFWDELGSLGLRGISPRLCMTATNSENLMLRFWLCIQKNLNQNSWSSRFGWLTQKPFSRMKILEDCTCLFWVFATAKSHSNQQTNN